MLPNWVKFDEKLAFRKNFLEIFQQEPRYINQLIHNYSQKHNLTNQFIQNFLNTCFNQMKGCQIKKKHDIIKIAWLIHKSKT